MGDAAASTSGHATPTSILICWEDGNDIFPDTDDGADFFDTFDDSLLLVDQDDEYVAMLLSKESASASAATDGVPAAEMEEWMKAARSGCVRWIIKVVRARARSLSPLPRFAASMFLHTKKTDLFRDSGLCGGWLQTTAMFRFSGKTAYIAVTYLDRFLEERQVDRGKEWALQLVAVACLSLASKVEEHRAPRLSEFRLDAYEFDSASILRMELLVLGALRWRMAAATPFPYISCFAARFRPDERRAIVVRAVECVFATIKAMSSVEYQPSTVALASILVARGMEASADLDELKAILGSSWPQLDTGHVYSCYSAMIREEDKFAMEVAASGVSVAAHVGRSPDANNATATGSPETRDNKRRLPSPQQSQ